MMAAAAALVLSSCDKGPGSDDPNGGMNAEQAGLRINLTLPNVNGMSRAVPGEPGENANNGEDIAGTTEENTIETVTVYVFNGNGLKMATGGAKDIAWADFSDDLGDGDDKTWGSTTAYDVTSGAARIYVAINVPDAWLAGANGSGGFATEGALLAAVGSIGTGVTPANQLDETAELTFVSPVVVETLIAETENKVAAELDRVASKVVATAKTPTIATDPAATWSNGVTLSYNILEYNVYNEAVNSYFVKTLDGSTLSSRIRTFDQSYYKSETNSTTGANKPVRADAAFGSALAAYGADYYIAENKSSDLDWYIDENDDEQDITAGLSRNGNTTFAMVATQVIVNQTAVLTGFNDGDGIQVGEGTIAWTGAANNVAANGTLVPSADDLWIIVKAAQTYIVKGEIDYDSDDADTVDDTNQMAQYIAMSLGGDDAGVKVYHYTDSFVHFLVWLNKNGKNDYNIGRNEYIHIDIQGVNGLDGYFPGYPGDPEDPHKPIDPIDDDPNNPDPKKPEDPVDPLDAKLIVNITVNPWTFPMWLSSNSRIV